LQLKWEFRRENFREWFRMHGVCCGDLFLLRIH
jgi:hypothetical protein